MTGWSNWSGSVRAPDAAIVRPHDLAELRAELARAARHDRIVRVAGAGHSFTPLVATDDVVIDLGAFCGVLDVDRSRRRATVGAGTPVFALGAPLWEVGLALHNQGDIDTQTVGGAIGTGTHGTGPGLGCLSTAVHALTVVLADGTVVTCDATREPDLWAAGRLSLGAVGVVVAVELALEPAYHLHERTWVAETEDCLDALDELIAATRHFEFFWLPDSDRCFAKALAVAPGPPDELADRPHERVDRAYRIFPSIREDRFNEMEFAVPAEAGPACFAELRELYRTRHPDVVWPVEYRTQAPDDTWIGPARGRATVTLSVHEGVDRPYQELFTDAEAVFRNHDGRPHWGKHHGLDPAALAAHHPDWDRFWDTADAVDPRGRFRSAALRALSGR